MLFLAILLVSSGQLLAVKLPLVPEERFFPTTERCDDERSRFNGSCVTRSDCLGGLDCVEGTCKCRKGTIEKTWDSGPVGAQVYCIRAPRYRRQCTDQCQEPFVCQTDPLRPLRSQKICLCPTGTTRLQGSCFKECNPDEFFAKNEVECRKRCQANEVKIDNKCLPMVELRQTCLHSQQCIRPFSECLEKICQCQPGFLQENETCTAQEISCPSGSPLLTDSGSLVSCQKVEKPIELEWVNTQINAKMAHNMILPPVVGNRDNIEDTCPKKYECQVYNPGGQLPQKGHCCPTPPKRCPIGVPHPNASCTRFKGLEGPDTEFCPHMTHYCHQIGLAKNLETICCPKPCKYGDIYHENRCYSHVNLGDPCLLDQQCQLHNGQCTNGMCECQENAVLRSRGLFSHCDIVCSPNEFRHGKMCISRRKIGQTCTSHRYCPVGGQCIQGLCKCRCGLVALNDQYCAPKPSCSLPDFNIKSFQKDSALDPEGTSYCKTNEDPLRVELDNATLVSKCPQGQYCNSYVANLGICCPIPKPKCPDGSSPVTLKNCDNEAIPCGKGHFCHSFISLVDNGVKSVCCPEKSKKTLFQRPPIPSFPVAPPEIFRGGDSRKIITGFD